MKARRQVFARRIARFLGAAFGVQQVWQVVGVVLALAHYYRLDQRRGGLSARTGARLPSGALPRTFAGDSETPHPPPRSGVTSNRRWVNRTVLGDDCSRRRLGEGAGSSGRGGAPPRPPRPRPPP